MCESVSVCVYVCSWSDLEAAEGVLLAELHGRCAAAEVTLSHTPEGLQLVPSGQNGVALVAQDRRGRESAGCVKELTGLRRLLVKHSSYKHTHTWLV